MLAAGEASRMGSIKQLLPYNNSTLLEITIQNALASKARKVYCVLGANSEAIKSQLKNSRATFINNPNWKDGLSSSIVTGVSYLESIKEKTKAILIMLSDQPNVDSDYIDALINLYSKNQDKVIASDYGDKKGVPAIFPKLFNKQLMRLKGDKGAKDFLNNKEINIITLASKNRGVLKDIDTLEDYNKLLDK
ncbi:nucleotidyltransferase family protein [uncultured Algibacter sp.]|uniref:nucleotidyltransferase family protein n=1 Tax=uncultured Algibacter sp. TaxID=298659 RepID=UPI00262650CE|nr:nucleotidyltransferase family protein [uncultured Algibacter sp.]